MKILDRYNDYYNMEMSALPHGMALSMEHLQAITLECSIKAFARKYNYKESIPVEDLLYLANELMRQGERAVGCETTLSNTNEAPRINMENELEAL